MNRVSTFLSFLFFPLTLVLGQNSKVDSILTSKDRSKPITNTTSYPKLKISGVFQGRFVASLNENIDINSKYIEPHTGTTNTFMVRFARLQVKANISDRTEIFILGNLADSNNKILENASIKYNISPKLALQLGQFRPWFGLEETFPMDIMKTLDWSNQYSEFGNLGWTSFQIGASLLGEGKIKSLPFQYAVSIVNGNGRNQLKDNDDGKLLSSRFSLQVLDKNRLNIGLNGGYGKTFGRNTHAIAGDISGILKLSRKWELNFAMEAKQGINHYLYNNLDPNIRGNLDQYKIKGFYILPDFRYSFNNNQRNLTAIEFSCRYEYLDQNYDINSNPRTSLLPMVGLEFLKNYGARVQLGAKIDRYKNEYKALGINNSNLMILQVQTRF